MKVFLTLVLSLSFLISFSQKFTVGDRVDAYAVDGKYYAATVLEIANNQYKLRYLNFGPESDAWTTEENLVRGGVKGEKIIVATSSEIYRGIIEAVSSNSYKIKYDGYPNTYTLTRSQFSFAETKTNKTRSNTTDGSITPIIRQQQQSKTQVATTVNGIYPVGAKLLGLEGTTWYAATVLEYNNGKYKVKWDLFGTEGLLTSEQLKARPTLPADKARPVSGKLYLRALRSVASGYSDIEWFFLGDNGLIIVNPMFGTNPINPTLELGDNFNKVGTYTIGKRTLDVNWISGYKTSYPLTMSNGEILELDGGVMARQKGLPENFKLNGTYDGTTFFGSLQSSSTYTFTNDGKVTLSILATAGVGGAKTETQEGRYTIKGNTLTITFNNGRRTISNIGMLEGNGKSLIVNNKRLTKL